MQEIGAPVILRGAWPSRALLAVVSVVFLASGLQSVRWAAGAEGVDRALFVSLGTAVMVAAASLLWQVARSRVELHSDLVVVRQMTWGRRQLIPRGAVSGVRSSGLGSGLIPSRVPVLDCRAVPALRGYELPHAISLTPLLSWTTSRQNAAVEARVERIRAWLDQPPAANAP
jgi:hypothetical protein